MEAAGAEMEKVVWISHRGLDADCVENSEQAFRAAAAAGFQELETDLRSTRDGHIVLHHDPHMQSTAGVETGVEGLTLDEFQGITYRDGQRGLSFPEFARRFDTQRWILDIKPESGARTLRSLYDWARQSGVEAKLLQQARFLLWSTADEYLLQKLFPGAVTLARLWECRRAGLAAVAGVPALAPIRPRRTYSLPPSLPTPLGEMPLFRRRMFQRYQRRGARVLAYLPPTDVDLQRAVHAGADEVLLDGAPPLPPRGKTFRPPRA